MQKKQVFLPVIILIGVIVLLFVISLLLRKKESSIKEVFEKEIAAKLKDGYSVKDVLYESLDNKNQQVLAIIRWEGERHDHLDGPSTGDAKMMKKINDSP